MSSNDDGDMAMAFGPWVGPCHLRVCMLEGHGDGMAYERPRLMGDVDTCHQ